MKKNDLDVANRLITHFVQAYIRKLGKKPLVNRGKLKFAIAEILQDWNEQELKSFITYYVNTETQPDLADFYRRYDEIIEEKNVEETDARVRRDLMRETRESVLKFREQYKGAK